MSKPRLPQRGDFIKIDFDPQAGREQAGWRPALVVSEAAYNARSNLALVCPVTNQAKGYPFEVPIPEGGAIQGVVLADHIKSADWKVRGAKYVETAPKQVLDTVREYLALLIGVE